MTFAKTLGFLSGYFLFTAALSGVLVLTNKIEFAITSLILAATITAMLTALGILLKKTQCS